MWRGLTATRDAWPRIVRHVYCAGVIRSGRQRLTPASGAVQLAVR
jgi:hypothetical protein